MEGKDEILLLQSPRAQLMNKSRLRASRAWFLAVLMFPVLITQWASLFSFQTGLLSLARIQNIDQQKSEIEGPFNPFEDLTIQETTFRDWIQNPPRYSTHRCVQPSESFFAPFVSRTCLFSNLYFHYEKKTFHYFASPAESATYTKEELKQMFTTANGYMHTEALERAIYNRDDFSQNENVQFTPIVHHNEQLPSLKSIATIKTPTNPVFTLYRPSYSFNYGHFLWDDAMGIFTMLDFFGYSGVGEIEEPEQQEKPQPIPVYLDQGEDPFYRCSRELRWDKCLKMLRKTMPKLMGIETDKTSNEGDILRAGNLFDSFFNLTESITSQYVLLPKVISGPGRNSHFGCKGECTIHRTGRIYRFRQWLFQNIFGTEHGKRFHQLPAIPNKITVSLPIGNTHSPEELQNFEEIVPALKAKYGSRNVHAVDMAKLTIEEQAQLTASSKVYLSNNGGGSATSFFLQKGSSVLLFHTDDMKRDIELYSTVGYLNVNWLPVTDSVDHVLKIVDRALAQPAD